MIDATPAKIKLLVADVVAYKWNVAADMIARCWRRYIFHTRAATLIGTSASTVRPVKVSAQVMQLQAENAQLKRQLAQHKDLTFIGAPLRADVPGFEQPPLPDGRCSRPMLRKTSGGTAGTHEGAAPESEPECSSFGEKINWI